ncbi:MAG: extracellular solute-binding protein [Chloroflexi bacterium]|nr:extracellular solute-binding protein [Chloroflexota bacterium]
MGIQTPTSRALLTRRQALLTLGLVGAGALATACGGGAAQLPATKPPAAAAPTTAPAAPAATTAAGQPTAAAPAAKTGGAVVQVWQQKLFTQAANDLSKKQITDFLATQSMTAEVSDLPTDYIAKLIPAIEAGSVPDLVQTNQDIAQIAATGGLLDMTEQVKELITQYGQPFKLMERPALLEGKWMGVPWFHYADAWFLRKDILGAAGLKPETLRTFDQLRDAALKTSAPDKQLWGWGLTLKSNTGDGDILARLLLDTHGATISDETGTKVIVGTTNKEAAIKAIEWAYDTYTNKKWEAMLPPGVMGWTGSSNNENFLGGKIVMTQNASSVYWAAKNQNSPYFKDTFVGPLASMPGKELSGGYPYYHIVFTKSKNREVAVKTSKFMSEEKQTIDRTKVAEGQSWPAFTKVLESQAIKDFVKSDPGYEQLLKNSTHESGWLIGYPGPMTPAAAAVSNQFLQAKAFESVIGGQVKAAQAVDELHKAAVEIYKSFGFKQ